MLHFIAQIRRATFVSYNYIICKFHHYHNNSQRSRSSCVPCGRGLFLLLLSTPSPLGHPQSARDNHRSLTIRGKITRSNCWPERQTETETIGETFLPVQAGLLLHSLTCPPQTPTTMTLSNNSSSCSSSWELMMTGFGQKAAKQVLLLVILLSRAITTATASSSTSTIHIIIIIIIRMVSLLSLCSPIYIDSSSSRSVLLVLKCAKCAFTIPSTFHAPSWTPPLPLSPLTQSLTHSASFCPSLCPSNRPSTTAAAAAEEEECCLFGSRSRAQSQPE